jgi:hypothetical protein
MATGDELVQESWNRVQPRAKDAAATFYARLTELDPEAELLLYGQDPAELARRLTRAIHNRVYAPVAAGEAQSFGDAWANPRFTPLGTALFAMLEHALGASLTASTRMAWISFFCRNAAELRAALLEDASVAAPRRSRQRYAVARD